MEDIYNCCMECDYEWWGDNSEFCPKCHCQDIFTEKEEDEWKNQ